jgi:hypothetical protein
MANKIEIPGVDSDRVKAAVANVAERAKATREQLASRRAEFVQFSQDNLEALRASGKILADGVKPIADEVLAVTKRQLDAANETMKSVRAADSTAERIKLQREATKASFEAYQADTKAFGQSVVKLMTDAVEPLKVRVQAARDAVAA